MERIIDIKEINKIDLTRAKKYEQQGDYEEAITLYKEIASRLPESDQRIGLIKKIALLEENLKSETEIVFRVYKEKSFKDVIGLKEQKKYVKKMIELPLKNLDHFKALSLKPSTGLLLYGAPGTGKTALIESVSGELDIPMADIKVSDILSKYIGEPEAKIERIFKIAKEKQPCILFLDELDALGSQREGGEGYGAELKSITTALLKELSNVTRESNNRIFICGATNLPWSIDDALKRSGRIDQIYYIPNPSFTDRIKLLKLYTKTSDDKSHVGHIDYLILALATTWYSGADLEKICKIAKANLIQERIKKNNNKIKLSTKHIRMVLRDKSEGRSSLEEWALNTWSEWIKPPKYRRTKGIFSTQKELVDKGGKFDKEKRQLYKDLCKEVYSYIQWQIPIKIIRFIARGI